MRALLEAFPDGRSIVLLDNLEDVIDPATLTVSDAGLDAALGELLAAPAAWRQGHRDHPAGAP